MRSSRRKFLPVYQPALEEFKADLEAIAEGTDDLPVLPPEALNREAIYGDDN